VRELRELDSAHAKAEKCVWRSLVLANPNVLEIGGTLLTEA
jgi:hypothetical protein